MLWSGASGCCVAPKRDEQMIQPTTEECIALAQALEQRRALGIVEQVAALPVGGKDADAPTPFQAGYQLACEEILHRLRTEVWDGCLPPVAAKIGKAMP